MGLLQDVRFGIRVLSRNPWFTLVVVLTVALGISVNTTVFTIVNAVFINGLPFRNSQELVYLRWSQASGGPSNQASYPDFLEIRGQTRTMQGLAAFTPLSADVNDQDTAAERVSGASISANMFTMFGERPMLGRDLTPEDEKTGAPPVVLISHFLWQSRYGGKPDVLGRSIRVNLKSYTVIGVMPEGESFPQGTRLWLPILQDEAHQKRNQRNVELVGRLAPGISIKQGTAELQTVSSRLAKTYPDTNKDLSVNAISYTERSTGGPIRTVLYSMQGAVGFVLLIACANVANLLLSRAVSRTRETSIRTAVGASRWRIIRQFLIESVMLSLLGGVLGLGLAVFGVRWFDRAVTDTGKPYWIVFRMDAHVFAYFLVICVATGILFGLAPALQISKTNVNENLKEGGRGTMGGLRARRLTAALLVGQIALTIVLLAGAGLMIRSFMNVQRLDLGVQPAGIVTVQIQPAAARYPQAADRFRFEEGLRERLVTLPGMSRLTIASQAPAGGAAPKTLKIEGRNMTDSSNRLPVVDRVSVAPGYFEALDIKVTRGRSLTAADGVPGGEVAIINEVLVAKYFQNEDPLGKRIRLGSDTGKAAEDTSSPWLTIVGVSSTVFQRGGPNNDIKPQPTLYVPLRQDTPPAFTVLARSGLPKNAVVSSIRNELRKADPDLPLYNIRTIDDILEQQTWPYRVFGTLFAVFALIALVISSVGIYGVTAHGVGQRTQELGVRMALGANQTTVMWLILKQALKRITIGLSLGLAAAFGVSRVLASLLVNIAPTDPATFVSISILLATITIAACLIPAMRAMRLDPVEALRSE